MLSELMEAAVGIQASPRTGCPFHGELFQGWKQKRQSVKSTNSGHAGQVWNSQVFIQDQHSCLDRGMHGERMDCAQDQTIYSLVFLELRLLSDLLEAE